MFDLVTRDMWGSQSDISFKRHPESIVMRITAEVSLYPLADEFVGSIKEFIAQLRAEDDLEVVSNQMSTQIRGEFQLVSRALQSGMRKMMESDATMVFVVKYLNADLAIGTAPDI